MKEKLESYIRFIEDRNKEYKEASLDTSHDEEFRYFYSIKSSELIRVLEEIRAIFHNELNSEQSIISNKNAKVVNMMVLKRDDDNQEGCK